MMMCSINMQIWSQNTLYFVLQKNDKIWQILEVSNFALL
jgi:hypothetical protein